MKNKDTQNIKKSFGNKIRYYRTLKGLTQSQLAEIIGKTEETVSNIERGLNSTKLEIIEQIAKTLSIDIMELFNFNEESGIKDKEKFASIKEVLAILNEKDKKYINALLKILQQEQE